VVQELLGVSYRSPVGEVLRLTHVQIETCVWNCGRAGGVGQVVIGEVLRLRYEHCYVLKQGAGTSVATVV
jgi:hypothetical protein